MFDEDAPGSYLSHAVRGFFSNGGTGCYIASFRDDDGPARSWPERFESALDALEEFDDVAYMCSPDIMAPSLRAAVEPEAALAMQMMLMQAAERRGRVMAVLDSPPDLRPEEVYEWLERARLTSYGGCASLYYPWLLVRAVGGDITVPPCGHVAGVYARVHRSRGPHEPPANERLEGISGVATSVSLEARGRLNTAGINVLRDLPDQGTHIWGARTLSPEVAHREVKDRLFLNAVYASLEAGLSWSVFQRLNAPARRDVMCHVDTFLRRLWKDGVLIGNREQDAYFLSGQVQPMTFAVNIGLALDRRSDFQFFRVVLNPGPPIPLDDGADFVA
jgi:phage tail sheath protein FI